MWSDMKTFAVDILSKIPSVDYADVRVVEQQSEKISTRNGVVGALKESHSYGYNVRILKNGAWGFAASHDFTAAGIDKTIQKALIIAEFSARHKKQNVIIDQWQGIQASYKTLIGEDPFNVPIEEKVQLLLAADKAMKVSPKVVITETGYEANKEIKFFASSEGSIIDQEIVWTGCGIEATAVEGEEMQNRSYPNSARGQNMTRGFEMVRELDLVGNAPRVGEEVVSLLTAAQCPSGVFDIILSGNQMALQIHESCGHAVELDRVLGYEASYAGTSFLTPEKLNTFQYGSSIVNLTADATIPGALGTFGYDDEGVPAQKIYLVKDGIFRDYITSRDTVAHLRQIVPSYSRPSNGTVRASSWSKLPMIRMTNINLEPGTWKFEDIIADTKNGIYMETNRSWSIDDKRYNFQFGTEVAWEVKNGKKGRMFKNPTYQGITPQFWNSCDAICNKDYWTVWGTPNCGKGQPSQVIYTGHGASPARFRNIKVGVM